MLQEFPNRELVVYALWLLGGESEKVHTEDIAIKCHALFSGSFSWVKHPQFPDKDIVRVALTDARKEKYFALVEGRTGQKHGLYAKTKRRPTPDGWTLTYAGIEWIKKNLPALQELADSGQSKEHRQKVLRQLGRVKQHRLFEEFLDNSDFFPSIGDLAELFRCRVDADPAVWEERFESVLRKAHAADQEKVMKFIEKCNQAYLDQR